MSAMNNIKHDVEDIMSANQQAQDDSTRRGYCEPC